MLLGPLYFFSSYILKEPMIWLESVFFPVLFLFAPWLISVWGTKTEDKYHCANVSKIMSWEGEESWDSFPDIFFSCVFSIHHTTIYLFY